MELLSRAFCSLVMTVTVVTPLASFAALPAEAQSTAEQTFNAHLSEADWNKS